MAHSHSATAEPIAAPQHGEHDHPRFLAHHYGSMQQQFDAGKFGMWLFLITEVLFFSGLFCAYAVYRSMHPEAFANADQFLDAYLGATNTAILILSSLTMAWAVRASQLGQQRLLVILLTITLACASIFLGVKAVEYSHKWDLGILWASKFHPTDHAEHSSALLVLSIPAIVAAIAIAAGFAIARSKKSAIGMTFTKLLMIVCLAFFGGIGIGKGVPLIEQAITGESHDAGGHTVAAKAHDTTEPTAAEQTVAEQATHEPAATPVADPPIASTVTQASPAPHGEIDPTYTGIFFSIYYVMTGLHAIHILGGMGTIAWLLWRSLRGDFGPDYYGPVDYVGLYWHLVDLIWIYLFPLLYLIG